MGVEDVAEAEEILNELRDEMLDELDAIGAGAGRLSLSTCCGKRSNSF